MIDKKFVLICSLLFSGPVVSADELLLKEGKTLTGRITKEDSEEYTIELQRNMYLRVPKENVAKVIRTNSESTVAPVTPKRIVISSSPVSSPVADRPISPVPPLSVGRVKVQKRESNNFQIVETVVSEPGPAKISSPYSMWVPAWTGVSGTEEGKAKWVSGVITATITIPAPRPDDRLGVALEEGRQKIFSGALNNFSETLFHLRSDSLENLKKESDSLFEEMKTQTDNRQQGYIRRMTSRPPTKK